jgi:AraC-like DNA-binding protein
MPRADRHNEIEVNLLQSGTLVYLLAGQRVEVISGQLTAFWACVPHRIVDFEGVGEYFVLTVPLTWFLQWRLGKALTRALLHGEIITDPQPLSGENDLRRFPEWCDDLASGSRERHRVCALEVEARWRRLALDLSGRHTSTPASISSADPRDLSHAERMASFMARNYRRPLTVQIIAEEAGLHPSYAMTVFRHAFGCTLIQHLTQHRLHHAQRLLATTDTPTAEIALLAGFGSTSRFHETFRDAYGCTPRDFRSRVRPIRDW